MGKMLAIGALIVLAGCKAAPPRQASLTTWTDPDTGCIYHIVDEGYAHNRVYSMTIRFRRDGTPDCPDARAVKVEP